MTHHSCLTENACLNFFWTTILYSFNQVKNKAVWQVQTWGREIPGRKSCGCQVTRGGSKLCRVLALMSEGLRLASKEDQQPSMGLQEGGLSSSPHFRASSLACSLWCLKQALATFTGVKGHGPAPSWGGEQQSLLSQGVAETISRGRQGQGECRGVAPVGAYIGCPGQASRRSIGRSSWGR